MDLLVRYEHKMYAQTDMFSKSAACFEFEGEVCHFSASSGSKWNCSLCKLGLTISYWMAVSETVLQYKAHNINNRHWTLWKAICYFKKSE